MKKFSTILIFILALTSFSACEFDFNDSTDMNYEQISFSDGAVRFSVLDEWSFRYNSGSLIEIGFTDGSMELSMSTLELSPTSYNTMEQKKDFLQEYLDIFIDFSSEKEVSILELKGGQAKGYYSDFIKLENSLKGGKLKEDEKIYFAAAEFTVEDIFFSVDIQSKTGDADDMNDVLEFFNSIQYEAET